MIYSILKLRPTREIWVRTERFFAHRKVIFFEFSGQKYSLNLYRRLDGSHRRICPTWMRSYSALSSRINACDSGLSK